jgi:uncharacterized protein (DUF1015 family)
MKIYPFQAIYPNLELIASPDSFFGAVRENYSELFQYGFFHHSTETAFYILEIQLGDKLHTGLLTCFNIDDYTKGKIVRHEQTIASSEQTMLKLILQRGAMVKPVLLCHPVIQEIAKEIQKQKKKHKPFLEISMASGVNRYKIYQVKESEAGLLAELYRTLVPKLYIADGHHRCSVAEKLLHLQGDKKDRDYSMVLGAVFPADQLDILDYNRTVQLPYHIKLTRFMAEVSKLCHISALSTASTPVRKHDLTMYLQEEWYQLTWKEEVLKKYKKEPAVLDAHLLDKEILEGILGITDLRTDHRVDYVSGDQGPERVAEKAHASDHHVGFCIYPVKFAELVKVSDHHGTLPPKSTWFEPRMINGMIVKSY